MSAHDALTAAGVDVEAHGRPGHRARAAWVRLPGARDRVRVRADLTPAATTWRCDSCGRYVLPICPHAVALAAHLILDALTPSDVDPTPPTAPAGATPKEHTP